MNKQFQIDLQYIVQCASQLAVVVNSIA